MTDDQLKVALEATDSGPMLAQQRVRIVEEWEEHPDAIILASNYWARQIRMREHNRRCPSCYGTGEGGKG